MLNVGWSYLGSPAGRSTVVQNKGQAGPTPGCVAGKGGKVGGAGKQSKLLVRRAPNTWRARMPGGRGATFPPRPTKDRKNACKGEPPGVLEGDMDAGSPASVLSFLEAGPTKETLNEASI